MKTTRHSAQCERNVTGQNFDHHRRLIRLAVFAACFPSVAFAAPQGGQFKAGSGSITQSGNQTLIQAGNKSIIQYSGFDIGRGESVRFLQPGKNATVLNRVLSNDPTRIFGQLQANGKIYIVNPFGIYFQNGSMINVGGLYAAAGKLSDNDFLASKNNFTNLQGAVINRGTLKSTGDVGLAGSTVANTGYINAPAGTVAMSSGLDVLIGDRNGNIFVQATQKKTPAAQPKLASGDLFSMAVVNSGVIRGKNITVSGGEGKVLVGGRLNAVSTQATGGKIEITGKKIVLSNAQLDASGKTGGGTILVGGDYQGGGDTPRAEKVVIGPKSNLTANATQTGNGGKVIVWSDDTTLFRGKISAKGGVLSGGGGLAEVSGKKQLSFEGLVDLTAPSALGKVGVLLLDPAVINIVSGAAAADDSQINDSAVGATDTNAGPTDFAISATKLVAQLNLADVSLAATASVNFTTTVDASGNLVAHGLTVTAPSITFSPGANLLLSNALLPGPANLSLNGTISIAGATTLSTGAGAGTLTSGDIILANNASLILGSGGLGAINLAAISGTTGGNASNVTFNTSGLSGGAISISGAVGTDIGTLTVTNSSGITFANSLQAANVVLTNTVGTISFQGNTTINTALTTSANGYDMSFTGSTNSIAGATTFLNTGTSTIGNAATDNTLFIGGLTVTSGPVNLAGTIRTTGAPISLSSLLTGTTLADDATLQGSSLTVSGLGIDGANNNLTLDINTAFTLTDNVLGAIKNITDFTSVKAIKLDGVFQTAGSQTYQAGLTLVSNSTLNATGITITSGGITGAGFNLVLRSGTGDTSTTGAVANINNLTLQANVGTPLGSVIFNDGVGAATLTTFSRDYNVALLGGANITNATIFNNTGSLTLGNGALDSITFTGGLTALAPTTLNLAGTISSGANPTSLAAATLTAATTLTGSSLTLSGPLTGANQDLTLDFTTAITLPGNISGVKDFTSAKAISVNGVFETSGTQTYNALLTLTGNSTLKGTSLTLAAAGITSFSGNKNLTLDFTTAFTLPGNITNIANFTSEQAIKVAGDFTTTGTQTYKLGLKLAANSNLNATGLTITTGGIVGGGFDLGLVSGAGTTTVTGSVTNVGNLTLQKDNVTSTGKVTFNNSVGAATLTIFAQAYDIAFLGGGTLTSAATFLNTGVLTLGDAVTDFIAFNGGVTATAPASVHLAGTVSTTGAGALILGDANTALVLDTDAVIQTNLGSITLGQISGPGRSLDITSNTSSDFFLPVTALATLDVSTLGNILQSGALTITGAASFETGAKVITLLDSANDFGGTVLLANTGANNVSIQDANALAVGTISTKTIGGNFIATAGGNLFFAASDVLGGISGTAAGDISQTGLLNAGQASTFTITSPTFDVLLASFDNDFNGITVSGSLRDVSLRDISPIVVFSIPANLRNLNLEFVNSAIALPSLTLTGNLSASAGGNITETGNLQIDGNASLEAGANDILLNTNTNNFGSLTFDGNTVAISEASNTVLTGSNSAADLTLGSTGTITDASGTTLEVLNNATFDAGTNAITLGNDATDTTDFGSLTFTGGAVTITEDSATVFTGVNTAASLFLTSAGTITDAIGTTFAIANNARFDAGTNAITLGDDATDTTNFGTLTFNGSDIALTEDSATILSGSSGGTSLVLTSAGTITDAAGTTLNVTNNADFQAAANDIILGDNPGDTLNFGSLTFTGGAVAISEDSDTLVAGVNTATSLVLSSTGTIGDSFGTTFAITNNASFVTAINGSDITLGDSATDVTNFGSLTILGGDVTVTEDSATILTGTNNARSLKLVSNGSITDAIGTSLVIGNSANFDAGINDILLGDNVADVTKFDFLTFNGGTVTITQDNGMIVEGINSGVITTLTSSGDIRFDGQVTVSSLNATANGDITSLSSANLNVAANANFNAGTHNIFLGNQVSDVINLGSLTFAAGDVSIVEDSASVLTGVNTANGLSLTSSGSITDLAGTTLAITGNAIFNAGANNIILGNEVGDTTNFGALNFTGGTVNITEDSGIFLFDVNQADTVNLVSSGTITDDIGTTLNVTGNARFNAGANSITLGENPADVANFGSLDFIGGNVRINEDSATILSGGLANTLSLSSAGSITQTAPIAVTGTSSFLAAGDILLNNPANDFGAAISANGVAITLRDTNALVLGRIQASGALNVAAPVGIFATANIDAFSAMFGSTTTLRGVIVTTQDFQNYLGNVFLTNASSKLASTGNGSITFQRKINGPQGLTVTTSGLTTMNGAVGDTSALASLTLNGRGQTLVNNTLVRTSGDQTWSDAVALNNDDHTFVSTGNGNILFGKTVSGPGGLTVTTNGLTTFNSFVGRDTALKNFTVNGGGKTVFKAGFTGANATVTTRGSQTYEDATSLAKASKFVSTGAGQIAFGGSLNSIGSPVALLVNTAGTTRFSGQIGQSKPLLSITTDAAGITQFSSATITTTAEQLYQDPVRLLGDNISTAGTATFDQTITGDSLAVSTTAGPLTFNAVVDLENLNASATGGDLFIPDATASGNLDLSSGSYIHLHGNSYVAGGSILFNATNPKNPQNGFSTILAENGDLVIKAGQDFTMALHQRFFVTDGSLDLTAKVATLGDTAASQNLTVNANSAVLLGREKLANGQTRQGDDDLGLSFVARTMTFNAPLSYSDQSERQFANFSVEKGQPFVAKIIGVTLFEDVNIGDQLLVSNGVFPIYQPVAGGVSQAEVAETIAGALARKRDDKVAEDDNISDDAVKKLGEIGVFPRLYDQSQDFSLEKQFLYYQRDAFQNPKIPSNYKVVTRRLQRELVTEVLEQSSKVNDMLPKCQAAIDRMQAQFKTTEAYTSEQAFLPYLETQLGTEDGKIVKTTLGEMKILFGKLPLLNLTAKEIDLAKNAIARRFPPANLDGETDIDLKRLLIENKQPEKASPMDKKPVQPAKSSKLVSL